EGPIRSAQGIGAGGGGGEEDGQRGLSPEERVHPHGERLRDDQAHQEHKYVGHALEDKEHRSRNPVLRALRSVTYSGLKTGAFSSPERTALILGSPSEPPGRST